MKSERASVLRPEYEKAMQKFKGDLSNPASHEDVMSLRRELKSVGVDVPPPPTNAKGWRILKDKNGRLAYVSPDNKEFEEIK